MAIQGNLQTIGIADLFSLLLQLRKTGILSVVTDLDERGFIFHEGDIVCATTRDCTNRLGDYLVRLGFLTEREINRILSATPLSSGPYLGTQFVEARHVTTKQLQAAINAQIFDILNEVLGWDAGAFYFDESVLPFQPDRETIVSTQQVLLETTRILDERTYSEKLFPDRNVVLAVNDGEVHGTLEPRQEEVLQLVDGESTVEQILFESTSHSKSTAEVLSELVSSGIVRKAGVKTTKGPAEPELRCVPLAPGSPGRILEILSPGTFLKSEVLDLLGQEPMLVAKLLKVLTLKNVDVSRRDLGLERLLNLVGDFHLKTSLVTEGIRGLLDPHKRPYWRKCWDHSCLCANLCERIAHRLGYQFPGEAYLVGLLHNLGVFLFMGKDFKRYRSLVRQSIKEQRDLESLEEQFCGLSHSKLGAMYAEKWKFPFLVRMAIKQHHHGREIRHPNPLLRILQVAVSFLQEKGLDVGHCGSAREQFKKALDSLMLSQKEIWLLFRQAQESLSGDVPASHERPPSSGGTSQHPPPARSLSPSTP